MTQPYNLQNIKHAVSGAIVSGYSNIAINVLTTEINNSSLTTQQKTDAIQAIVDAPLTNKPIFYFQMEEIVKNVLDKTVELLNDNVYITIPNVVTAVNFGGGGSVTLSTVTGRVQLI
jgi:hypothetical protein